MKKVPKPNPAETNDWNVMVYMAADNSLSEEGVFSLKELRRIGTVDGVTVTAQFHSSAKGAAPRRYSIKRRAALSEQAAEQKVSDTQPFIGDDDGTLDSEVEEIHLPANSLARSTAKTAADGKKEEELLRAANPAVLKEFLVSSIERNSAQAAHQLVILSGHASGAVGPFLKGNNNSDSFSISDLHGVFRPIQQKLQRNIDIVLMDSCLMSMAEVAYELYGKADLLIGAEGFELSTGWPYHRILDALNKASLKGIDAQALARELVNRYVRYYSDYDVAGVSVDQAVCDLQRSPALVGDVKRLQQALSERIEQPAILNAVLLAHWRAQSYNAERYVDLWDFCDQLRQHCRDKEIRAACQQVKTVIAGDARQKLPPFVLHSCFSGAAFQHSHGVSIYFPWAADTQDVAEFKDLVEYKTLKFSEETGWGDFLEQYLRASRREVRDLKEHQRKGHQLRCFIPTDDTRVGVRVLDPGSKGGTEMAAKMKNPPVEFFRETC